MTITMTPSLYYLRAHIIKKDNLYFSHGDVELGQCNFAYIHLRGAIRVSRYNVTVSRVRLKEKFVFEMNNSSVNCC